eukprot:1728021-Rhodomonas_salina.1
MAGRHIENGSLRQSRFEGEAEEYEIGHRLKEDAWGEMAACSRKQFPHGSRHQAVGSRFKCTQRTATLERLEELLQKPADHLAA